LGFFQDGDVRAGVFPEGKETVVRTVRLSPRAPNDIVGLMFLRVA
jgi:hypothetical protein